jgi:hypothetical protein
MSTSSASTSSELSLGDPETCALCQTITSSAKGKDGTDMSDMTLVFGNDGKCNLSWAKYNHVYFYVDKSGKNLLRVREYIDWVLLPQQLATWYENSGSRLDSDSPRISRSSTSDKPASSDFPSVPHTQPYPMFGELTLRVKFTLALPTCLF